MRQFAVREFAEVRDRIGKLQRLAHPERLAVTRSDHRAVVARHGLKDFERQR